MTTGNGKATAAAATTTAGDSTATTNVLNTNNHRSSRDRTRISAVQRLVERKMAQKEKDREKERKDLMFKHRSSSVGSASVSSSRMVQAAVTAGNGSDHPINADRLSLRRSLSRDRLSSDSSANKTYITITSGGTATRIRESSPSKKDQILNKYCSPLKSTEIFKDLVNDKNPESASKQDDQEEKNQASGQEEKIVKKNNIENNPEKIKENQAQPPPQELSKKDQKKNKTPQTHAERKISFTTEKTILINPADILTPEQAKIRKVSIDINYVYEQHYLSNPGGPEIIQDEQVNTHLHSTTSGGSANNSSTSSNNKETSKRRASLEQRIKERSHSASSSMSTSSCGSSSESASSACSSTSGGTGSDPCNDIRSSGSGSSSNNSDCSSLSTPEPIPRQSKQRKISTTSTSATSTSTTTNTSTSGFSRNINIILEDEISNENCETMSKKLTMPPVGSGLKLPKPKTSFHRRFSQDQSTMNVNIKRSSSPPVRKISLQNNSTINTDR